MWRLSFRLGLVLFMLSSCLSFPLHGKEMVVRLLVLLSCLCWGGFGGGGSRVAAAEAVAAVSSLPSITAGKCRGMKRNRVFGILRVVLSVAFLSTIHRSLTSLLDAAPYTPSLSLPLLCPSKASHGKGEGGRCTESRPDPLHGSGIVRRAVCVFPPTIHRSL